jgi:hypothetical protein
VALSYLLVSTICSNVSACALKKEEQDETLKTSAAMPIVTLETMTSTVVMTIQFDKKFTHFALTQQFSCLGIRIGFVR